VLGAYSIRCSTRLSGKLNPLKCAFCCRGPLISDARNTGNKAYLRSWVAGETRILLSAPPSNTLTRCCCLCRGHYCNCQWLSDQTLPGPLWHV
jgi:hypothetical protein